ncbi:hypothetical protein IE81DRAFT_13302 [Ceraceosorus guamensis]|uniref:Uncharacterized protein n=1 Tax=Ceraceosorus guamensis TaxID=1522189 RepID=A0A316VTX5_9BASI|nr:hypothetical protein IE81DRAFT_13302 [Ceraceosorus guamensis]PWN39691.1 hypothetical protein IE81DRAFT_13302 [Ceraceosorus guamensis]
MSLALSCGISIMAAIVLRNEDKSDQKLYARYLAAESVEGKYLRSVAHSRECARTVEEEEPQSSPAHREAGLMDAIEIEEVESLPCVAEGTYRLPSGSRVIFGVRLNVENLDLDSLPLQIRMKHGSLYAPSTPKQDESSQTAPVILVRHMTIKKEDGEKEVRAAEDRDHDPRVRWFDAGFPHGVEGLISTEKRELQALDQVTTFEVYRSLPARLDFDDEGAGTTKELKWEELPCKLFRLHHEHMKRAQMTGECSELEIPKTVRMSEKD